LGFIKGPLIRIPQSTCDVYFRLAVHDTDRLLRVPITTI